ncbi:hypothetical protein ACA910_003559 [Epithemia clementina (nom. ined.)]
MKVVIIRIPGIAFSWTTTALLLLLLVLAPPVVVGQVVYTECSEDSNATDVCANQGNRICLRNNETNVETCGNCLEGFINFRGTCYNITTEITTELVQDLIDEFNPTFRFNLTLEERVEVLQKVAQAISTFQAQIPPNNFTVALSKFSLHSLEELQALRGTRLATAEEKAKYNFGTFDPSKDRLDDRAESSRDLQTIPESIDWCSEGACTEVKDQGQCGCCWAVSTMAAVESAAYLTNSSGFLQSLSFQQLISCDTTSSGCNGGTLQSALSYTWTNTNFGTKDGGVTSLNDYPYADYSGTTTTTCNTANKTADVFLVGPKTVLEGGGSTTFSQRVSTMKQAVAQEPIAIVMSANCNLLYNYDGGILTTDSSCGCDPDTATSSNPCIDHAIVMVGYDDTGSTPYWIIRNSWGTDWGEDGYFWVASEDQGTGGYGLFNVLYEGLAPYKAYNNTADVPDNPTSAATMTAFGSWSILHILGALVWSIPVLFGWLA